MPLPDQNQVARWRWPRHSAGTHRVSLRQSLQGLGDTHQLLLAAATGMQRHGLALQGIHA
jgi:hypothetical protein